MTPLEIVRGWFDKLPPEIQKSIAPFAVTYGPDELYPDLEGERILGVDPATFRKMLDRAPRSPMAEVGKVLTVATIVDFVFLKRSTEEDWAKSSDFLSGASEFAKQKGYQAMERQATEWAAQLPLRSGMWIRESDRWKELRSTSLSLRNLHGWLDEELRKSTADL